MIKAKISKEKNIARFKTDGTVYDLCIETATMISEIYRCIGKKNPEAAKGYKQTILAMLLDPRTPVWEEETP